MTALDRIAAALERLVAIEEARERRRRKEPREPAPPVDELAMRRAGDALAAAGLPRPASRRRR